MLVELSVEAVAAEDGAARGGVALGRGLRLQWRNVPPLEGHARRVDRARAGGHLAPRARRAKRARPALGERRTPEARRGWYKDKLERFKCLHVEPGIAEQIAEEARELERWKARRAELRAELKEAKKRARAIEKELDPYWRDGDAFLSIHYQE